MDEIVVTKLQLVQWLGDSDDIEEWKECAKCKKIVFSDRCEKCKAFSLWELKCQVQSERFVRHLAFISTCTRSFKPSAFASKRIL